MAQYRYEYGKRWNAKVPRTDIKWLMSRVHVNTPDEQIAEDIRSPCIAPEYTASIIRQSIDYALECHHRNQTLYAKQMRGLL